MVEISAFLCDMMLSIAALTFCVYAVRGIFGIIDDRERAIRAREKEKREIELHEKRMNDYR